MTVNIAVVGVGYWGPNLARNVAMLPGVSLHTLCDMSRERLAQISQPHRSARIQTDYATVLADPQVHGIILATPVHTHFNLAKRALEAGKHVLVEKPLAATSVQCRELIVLAEAHRLTLMVGHIFLYNAAVRKVKEYIQSGELGEIYYIYSQRLNLGIVRQDVNALWNFAPQDISVLNYWLDAVPERVMAKGYSYLQPRIEDVIFMNLDYPGGVGCNVHISWLDPNKVRRMTVVGSKKMVVYDDVSSDAKIMVFDRGVTAKPNSQPPQEGFQSFGEFQLQLRSGDVLIPSLKFVEPLKIECQHFVDCIRSGQRPLTDGYDGLRVVQVLEAAQEALASAKAVEIRLPG